MARRDHTGQKPVGRELKAATPFRQLRAAIERTLKRAESDAIIASALNEDHLREEGAQRAWV